MTRCREELSLDEVRRSLRGILTQLRDMNAELAQLSSSLPAPSRVFEARAELGGVIRTVQTDLMADAITTLDRVATQDVDELRLEFQRRQEWLRRHP